MLKIMKKNSPDKKVRTSMELEKSVLVALDDLSKKVGVSRQGLINAILKKVLKDPDFTVEI